MDHTAIDFWLPRVQDLGVLTPWTELVQMGRGQDLYQLNHGKTPYGWIDAIAELAQAARRINGSGPVFLRSAYTAAKWDWRSTCCTSCENLDQSVRRIVAWTTRERWPAAPEWTFAVRRLIDFDSVFTTELGMPICRERRVFVDAGKVLCHHPLITDAMLARTEERVLPINWRARLAALNDPTWDSDKLRELARSVADSRCFRHHTWALDFAWAPGDRWVLLDMALAADAYHVFECPYATVGGSPYPNFHR